MAQGLEDFKVMASFFAKVFASSLHSLSTWFESLRHHPEITHVAPWCFETVEGVPKGPRGWNNMDY